MKKILITGGAGFIGSNLSLKLLSKGYDVTVLDNLSPQIHTDNPLNSSLYLSIKDKVNFIHGSVTNRSDWEKAIVGQDIIVHYAAETGTGQSMYQIERYTNVNIEATAILLDILTNTEHQVKRVLIASSRSIYGEGKYFSEKFGIVYPSHRKAEDMSNGDFGVYFGNTKETLQLLATDEESKIHPSSVYGITKQVQEQLIMTVCPTIGIEAVAMRYQNVYGPGQSLSNPYTGILSIFSNLILSGKSLNIFEDGLESRDFVYIDDVVEATVLGIEKDEAANEIFNVGFGKATDVLSIAKMLIQNYNCDTKINVSGNFRIGDIRHNYADLTKISSKLGFKPEFDFQKGSLKFCDWVRSQTLPESKYNESLEEMRSKGLFK
jgi:dTDP-L-rhamnose 4-epimerase